MDIQKSFEYMFSILYFKTKRTEYMEVLQFKKTEAGKLEHRERLKLTKEIKIEIFCDMVLFH